MKKDIEWLKEKLEVFQKGENMFTDEFNAGVQDTLEYVLELLDQLDKPEVLSQEWIDKNSALGQFATSDVIYFDKFVKADKLKNLLVPKQEKVKIPEFVAEWIESRDYYNVYKVLQYLSAPGSPHASKDVRNWIFRNQENVEKFVRAWLDGYEVEEEQKYYVFFPSMDKISKGFNYLAKDTYHNELWIEDSRTDGLDWEERSSFTEDEIRDLDKGDILFEHFAVKVEELEE